MAQLAKCLPENLSFTSKTFVEEEPGVALSVSPTLGREAQEDLWVMLSSQPSWQAKG